MLSLWRNVGERIMVGDDIVLTLLANYNGMYARVQIEAPTIIGDGGPRVARINIGEPFALTDSIKVHALEVDRGGVRFGIEAPREIRVDREEVHKQRRGKS